uniref:Uncharacterized protein n=1 Tax=Anguilla anguilla TaxID=7936 RepID=A0A0E9VVW0_ANGAN
MLIYERAICLEIYLISLLAAPHANMKVCDTHTVSQLGCEKFLP